MSHRDHDRRHHRGRRHWRDWDDWRFFGLGYNPFLATSLAIPATTVVYPRSTLPVMQSMTAPTTIQQVVLPGPTQSMLGQIATGVYRVVAPMGLNLRDRPDVYSNAVAVLRPGTEVVVASAAGNGWVRTAEGRYLCMNCAEGPGGPWLVPVSAGPFQVAAPSSNATFFGQDPGVPTAAGVLTDLGFRTRKIRGHRTRTVIARPEVRIFQPLTFFIPHDVAEHFDIREIRVGATSVLASRHGVPAERYECNGGAEIQLPPLLAGQPVFVKVKNRSGSSHKFRASFTGIAI